jgi:cobalt-zinc-cadmium efflux system outer membrane protein
VGEQGVVFDDEHAHAESRIAPDAKRGSRQLRESFGVHHRPLDERPNGNPMRRWAPALLALLAGPWAAALAAPVDCPQRPPLPLTLAAAEERVVPCNREVRAAMLALAAARGDERIARQRPNPTMTLGASNVNPHAGLGAGPLRDRTFDASVRVEQLFERGGKPALRARQAEALVEAAGAEVAEQVRAQRLALRNAFFDVAAAQERVRLQGEFRGLASQTAAAAKRRFDAGDVARTEATRFSLDAARAASDLRQAELDLQRARFELARVLGAEPLAESLEVRDGLDVREEQGVRDVLARPDVVAGRYRVLAAESAFELARRLATRDVTVGLQADRWPVSEFNTQGTGISYGLTLSVPLHVRHANEGEAARALADLDTARANAQRLQSQAAAEARLAENDWRAARERRERLEAEVRPLARDAASAAEFSYERGATGVLDLLDARRSLKAVELDELQARLEAAKAWARREAARTTIEDIR